MTQREAMDQWWRDHVAYAVDQRREMRTGHIIHTAAILLAVTSVAAVAAQSSWWITVPTIEFAAVFFAVDVREWIKSERNYIRSLRVRRAGLAAALK